jgi:hypothetical protein
MTRSASALLVLVSLAAVDVGGCSSDQTTRAIYDGLRRREERLDTPGEERARPPSYDEYQRTRPRPNDQG